MFPVYMYTEEELEQFENYLNAQFGASAGVIHEIASPDIHLDIHVIPPTEKNNYYTLITMGMGAYKMNAPEEEYEHAELVLYLPPTWDIHSETEECYWPIRLLKILGRLPLYNDTWVGVGHTISSDADNSPYASNTELCSTILLPAFSSDHKELDFRFPSLGKLNFYQLFPLYREELEYKQKHGAQALVDLFCDEDFIPIVNINRKNYCL